MRVSLSDTAAAELEEIGRFIAQDNALAAEAFVTDIVARCLTLGTYPNRHAVAVTVGGLDLRRCSYRGYLIFYAVRPDAVEIAHIFHGARDYLKLLFPSD